MEAVHCHVAGLELLGEVDGEQDLRQLALAIGPDAAIAVRQHDVVKVDRLLPGGGHIDDAGRRARLDERQEQPRQQEAREIVDRKAQLEAVGADLALCPGRADAGVVDEHVEAVGLAPHRIGQRAHLRERREVGAKEARLAAALRDPLDESLAPRAVAPVQDDARAIRREPLGDIAADAVGRAGDEDGLAL